METQRHGENLSSSGSCEILNDIPGVIPKSRVFTSGTRDLPEANFRLDHLTHHHFVFLCVSVSL